MSIATSSDQAGDPAVMLTPHEFLKFISRQCGQRGVQTDAAWGTAVDALTDAQVLLLMRALLKKWVMIGCK